MFEKYSNKPDVNLVSSEFWKMVLIANWKNVIHDYEHDPIDRGKYLENAKAKIYLKYDYEQIKLFYIEYHNFYMKLYEYFGITDSAMKISAALLSCIFFSYEAILCSHSF